MCANAAGFGNTISQAGLPRAGACIASADACGGLQIAGMGSLVSSAPVCASLLPLSVLSVSSVMCSSRSRCVLYCTLFFLSVVNKDVFLSVVNTYMCVLLLCSVYVCTCVFVVCALHRGRGVGAGRVWASIRGLKLGKAAGTDHDGVLTDIIKHAAGTGAVGNSKLEEGNSSVVTAMTLLFNFMFEREVWPGREVE